MAIRTATYIVCDECHTEKLTHMDCPNKKILKSAAKSLGFETTTKNEFCSVECKEAFKSKRTLR